MNVGAKPYSKYNMRDEFGSQLKPYVFSERAFREYAGLFIFLSNGISEKFFLNECTIKQQKNNPKDHLNRIKNN